MTTKLARLVFALLLAVLALGALHCSSSEEDAEEAKTLTIWWAQWAPADGLQELAKEFQAETGVAVKVHQIPWSSYQEEVFRNFGNKQTDFDIVVGDSQWIGRGATRGLYLDLTDWLPKAVDLDKIHPNARKYLCEYPTGSGSYYAAPCETDACGFAYRRDWFEDPSEQQAFEARYGRALAVPDTWEELREVAEFFTRPTEKRYGCSVLTGRGYDSLTMGFQHFLWCFGGSWCDERTHKVQGHVNSGGAVKGLEFMKMLLKYAPPGAENCDYSKAVENIKSGSVAMTMAYFAFYPDVVKEMGGKVGFFVIPGRGDLRFSSLGGQGFSISKKTPPAKQALARKFIAWFLQTKVQEKWITKPGGFTANVDVLGGEAFKAAAPYNEPFARSLDIMKDFWNVPIYNKLLAKVQQRVGEALDGQLSPKEALDKLAAEHEEELAEAGLLR
jgi:multiple sugar transport system substrate-binding protein